MARLPTPGADEGSWGSILNDYLTQVHKADGTLKDNIVSSSALAPGAVTAGDIQTATISEDKLDNSVQTKLNTAPSHTHADYLPLKNGISPLTDSTNDKLARVNISDDASPTAGWSDRLAFYFNGTRSGYFNEYGELRGRPGKSSTVAMRAMKWAGSSTVDIFQVASSDASVLYFTVGPSVATMGVPLDSTADITTTGSVSGSNIGNKVTAASTAPSSPNVGDVWVDLST